MLPRHCAIATSFWMSFAMSCRYGVMLEIASGTGEHIVHFARNLPGLVFQPSDLEPDASLSIAAWVKATGVTNVRAPIALEASHSVWPIASAEGIVCINMTHTSPWKATLGLLKAAAAILRPRRRSISMGPINGTGSQRPRATKRSTETFAIAIRTGSARSRSGRRDGALAGFSGPVITEMPANNLSVVFRRL